jgi:uncharacterized protein
MKIGGFRSSNVEDRRGGGMPLVAGGGIGGLVIALLVYFLQGTPGDVSQTQQPRGPEAGAQTQAGQDPMSDFVAGVLGETELAWEKISREQLGREYQKPTLVLFTNMVQSACGVGQAAAGPFYCPLDGKVYIDLSFYQELKSRFGAPGDAAQAYVIAHEVGHHVQNLMGISEQVHSARQNSRESEANELSVRQELQADCFAGVTFHEANKSRQILEPGDVEEALNAAAAIGDDRLQKQARGRVVEESFTHGSSAQRQRWLRIGLERGDVRGCDTFAAGSL